MSTADTGPLSSAEVRSLFAGLADAPVLILAVSGGPDSTALLWLASQWCKSLKAPPKLVAVTIDHGLRPEARREAAAVKHLARELGAAHRILRWRGRKPNSGLQQAARSARYDLLAKAAKAARAQHVLTAHTVDDQAETVLFRLARGSGIAGLAAMARTSAVPGHPDIALVRPLLDVPKARLIATLRRAGIGYADDPSNRDPRFTRARLRVAMPALAGEGLTAKRLAVFAQRMRRAEAALAAQAKDAFGELAPPPWAAAGPIEISMEAYAKLPAEIGLRVLGRVVAMVGDEGPVEMGKLEVLHEAVSATVRLRRTLAGAMVTLADGRLSVERAPARRAVASKRP